jgi:hypothetical protein
MAGMNLPDYLQGKSVEEIQAMADEKREKAQLKAEKLAKKEKTDETKKEDGKN